MNVVFNGQQVALTDTNLQAFIESQGAVPPFAVAVNGQFVPRSQCAVAELKEGDQIELLSPIQGG
ncbi:sulfur carrier protein ThiS [Pseudoalteromonas sp. SS15]|uniref:ThiS protein n=1 Tax=Pseudoalteromonas phenolica TaxID=161398 RepID=A0A0S2K674_9GAMM|nr:sulfur carrier protein ThiS [Pseudoalteromonas phenolica]ALO43458.1 ThiS protein [Pseudoalteromonas phenolica]MBE0355383.1 sulfur carrier protein [Pseudoalteromonas phenolica O-BC30]RXE96253.1 sulfur carrier protein ThiS [Pseudoalteromonas phenolica O-BC30]RZQ54615.1 thiamine biosynthesis protein ThiS [Pseudoalteromonas phenolica]TMN93996.1 thiamine biosynthesis protein ThiS [Pseudoalteromonas phenolica]